MATTITIFGTSVLVGVLLGLRFKAPAVIVASVAILGAAALLGLSILQLGAAVLLLQGGYLIGLFITFRQKR